MKERLAELDNVYFEQSLRVLRLMALVLPFAVIGLGFLVRAGMLDNHSYVSDLMFACIAIMFVLATALQYLNQKSEPKRQILVLVLFHILGGAFLLFVAGLFSPFLFCWLILYIATDFFLGIKGALINIAVLFLTFLLDMVLHPYDDTRTVLASMAALLFICMAGYIVSRVRDINEQERLAYNQTRRSESLQHERLNTLINAMGDAVINTDENGIIRVYNAAALSLLDTNATLSGQRIDSVLKLVDEAGKPVDILAYIHANDHVFSRRDLSHVFGGGERVNLYLNVSPIRPSYQQKSIQSGYIFIMRDITKEKSLEEERDEFISVVSHELRTPVAIMEGNISNVQFVLGQMQKDKKVEPVALSGALSATHEQVLYLAKMINDLSTLSRAERGVADAPEKIDVREMLEDMFKEYESQATAKGLRFNLDLGPRLGDVQASRLYLEEVLQNFVTNALKYTPKGSITLSAHRYSNYLEFAVQDTGIGISKSDQKHIFEKFYRSEDYRTRETSGTGLGLYVVHKLAHKLGVTVEFKSRLNHGSTFSFRLPLQ